MKKLFTTLCLVVVGLLATIPIRAEVGDIITYDKIQYQVISLNPNEASVYSVDNYITETTDTVDIPSTISDSNITYTVTQIGGVIVDELTGEWYKNGAFASTSFTKVNLPNTITYIGDYAFSNSGIETLELPNSLVYIGERAFSGCNKLINIELPNSVLEIGKRAFGDCKRLKTFTFAENSQLKVIPENMLGYCPSLESISIPNSVEIIGYGAFNYCNSLSFVKIGTGLKEVTDDTHGNYAQFAFCPSLKKIQIENCPINYVPYGHNSTVFRETPLEEIIIDQEYICNWYFPTTVTKITFGENVKTIGESAFSNCSITNLNIPESVVSIGNSAFSNCQQLKEINLPSSLQSIGDSSFSGCSGITSIALPAGLTTIGNNAFSSTSLATLTIPDGVVSLGSSAFSNCELLTQVSFSQNLKSIGSGCFYKCAGISAITLNNQLETIGSSAFANCSISNLEFPASLTTIDGFAFSNNNIGTLTLPKTLASIGERAFYGNPIEKVFVNTNANVSGVFPYENLTEVIFGENATTVPSFQGATKLRVVTLPELMETLPDNSFVDCISLTNVYFPEKLIGIGSNAFSGCSSLIELEIPANLTSIGSGAFSNCSSIPVMKLPDGVTSISSNLFANCTGLEKVYFSENVNSFGANAFLNCSSLRSLIIPDGVETIPEGMMQNCTSLTEILIPNSVETVSQNAFQGCTSLKNIDLGTGVYTIGDYAFADCPNITDIHSMALNPPIAESYTFPTKAYTNATVTVREQSLATYNRENPWYRFQNYLTVSGAISLSHYNVDMAGNEVFQLGVYGSDSEIKWSSSNPSVAYANDCGLIIAMGITGATVITATVDGEEINCNVTVSSPYRDPQAYTRTRAGEDDEDLQPVDVIMEGVSGNPPMVNVRLVPVGSKTIIDWTSSDPALASVQNGIVTVHADGDVDFGVETENGLEETVEVDTKSIENAGIEEIFSDTEIMTPINVYDLNGRIIYFNATLEQIKSLNSGLYIIKGKKVMIRK